MIKIIYDNNEIFKKDNLIKIVNKYLIDYKDRIIIIPCHDKLRYQLRAYNEFYKNNKFKWCMFIDCDEFVELLKWNNIKDMLNDKIFINANQICLYWREIGDNEIIEAPDDYVYNNTMFKNITDINEKRKAILEWRKLPLSQRFPKYADKQSEPNTIKSIIRGYNYLLANNTDKNINIDLHITLNIDRSYLLDGHKIIKDEIGLNIINYNGDHYNNGFVKHYRTLSLSEHLEKKFNTLNAMGVYRNQNLNTYYYKLNKETEDKNKYFDWFVHKYKKYNILYIYKDTSLVKEDNNIKYILNGYDTAKNGKAILSKNKCNIIPSKNNILNGIYLYLLIDKFNYVKIIN